jgi:hypothetical protein
VKKIKKERKTHMNTQLKHEIIRRMKKLNLMDQVINDFKSTELVYRSERGGILYWLDKTELELVSNFEISLSKFNAKVYHVIKRYTEEGIAYTYLYVTSSDLEKFHQEDFDIRLKDNSVFTYFDKHNTSYFSEHGTEYIESNIGGLMIPYVPNMEAYKNLRKFK